MKTDAHHGIARDIPAWRPSDAGQSLRTAGLWRLPNDHEGAQIIPLARPPLVAIGPTRWTDHGDLTGRLGGAQEFGIHRAAVEEVHAGEEITRGQVILDERAHDTIRGGRWRGHDGRDEVRLTLVTGFREVDRVVSQILLKGS
jgi:hypothetical protein